MATRENDARTARIPWWVPGDWDAFLGLGTNSILNILVLSGLLLEVVNLPRELVFGRIIPAVGVMLIISNVYYAFMARRLALRTGRTDVTAMPAGPSVPHMFIVVLLIMLPVYLRTGDPILAWQAGLAWNLIEGSVEVVGAFVAPSIKRITPRAALLGTLAGISIAFISMRPAQQIWLTPWIGFISLAIVIGGWMAGVRFPFRVPAGLLAIGVGTLIGWVSGIMDPAALVETLRQFSIGIPPSAIGDVVAGLDDVAPLLVTAIPFGIYDFMEAMNNVESAEAAGDSYSTRETMLVAGLGTLQTLRGAGVYYQGMVILGSGPILVGMILAAIAVFIIDKDWRSAIGYSLFGAVCSFFGIIHATQLGIGVAWGPTLGYLAVAAIALVMMLYRRERVPVTESPAPTAQQEAGASAGR